MKKILMFLLMMTLIGCGDGAGGGTVLEHPEGKVKVTKIVAPPGVEVRFLSQRVLGEGTLGAEWNVTGEIINTSSNEIKLKNLPVFILKDKKGKTVVRSAPGIEFNASDLLVYGFISFRPGEKRPFNLHFPFNWREGRELEVIFPSYDITT